MTEGALSPAGAPLLLNAAPSTTAGSLKQQQQQVCGLLLSSTKAAVQIDQLQGTLPTSDSSAGSTVWRLHLKVCIESRSALRTLLHTLGWLSQQQQQYSSAVASSAAAVPWLLLLGRGMFAGSILTAALVAG
jgi:hypothetical protein